MLWTSKFRLGWFRLGASGLLSPAGPCWASVPKAVRENEGDREGSWTLPLDDEVEERRELGRDAGPFSDIET